MRPATALEVVSRRLSLEDPEGEVERADEHEEQREEDVPNEDAVELEVARVLVARPVHTTTRGGLVR